MMLFVVETYSFPAIYLQNKLTGKNNLGRRDEWQKAWDEWKQILIIRISPYLSSVGPYLEYWKLTVIACHSIDMYC